jgi:hypothetical protein
MNSFRVSLYLGGLLLIGLIWLFVDLKIGASPTYNRPDKQSGYFLNALTGSNSGDRRISIIDVRCHADSVSIWFCIEYCGSGVNCGPDRRVEPAEILFLDNSGHQIDSVVVKLRYCDNYVFGVVSCHTQSFTVAFPSGAASVAVKYRFASTVPIDLRSCPY